MRPSSVRYLNGDDGGLMGLTLVLTLVGVIGDLEGALLPCLGVVCGGHSLSSSNVRCLGDDRRVVEILVHFFCLGVAGVWCIFYYRRDLTWEWMS